MLGCPEGSLEGCPLGSPEDCPEGSNDGDQRTFCLSVGVTAGSPDCFRRPKALKWSGYLMNVCGLLYAVPLCSADTGQKDCGADQMAPVDSVWND